MTLDEILSIRDEISATLLARVEGGFKNEHACVTQASKQLEQFGCMGGSTRAKAEAEIVRLVAIFNDTGDSGFGPWPVADFMQTQAAKGDAYKAALQKCIAAHKTGKYEPMVAAIEAAENLIDDLA